jgi:hypothetical protein
MLQPAAVLRGVVQLQLVGQPLGLGRRERRIQRRRRVGVEVVLHQHDPLGVGIVDVDQVLDAVRPVDPGAPVADHDLAPASQRLTDQEQIAHPAALVLIVFPGWPARRQRAGRIDLGEQLAAGLVQADLGAQRVIRSGGDPSTSSIRQQQLGVLLGRDAPALPSATA